MGSNAVGEAMSKHGVCVCVCGVCACVGGGRGGGGGGGQRGVMKSPPGCLVGRSQVSALLRGLRNLMTRACVRVRQTWGLNVQNRAATSSFPLAWSVGDAWMR